MTDDEVLDAAADLIEKKGRWRGQIQRRGRYNPMSAIVAVDGARPGADGAFWALRAEVGFIPHWNDNEPDDAVVLATIRRVATRLRGTKRDEP